MKRRVVERWYPIILARTEGAPTDDEHREFLKEAGEMLERYWAQRRKIVMILDLARAGALSAKQRKVQVDWLHRYRTAMEEVQVGLAFVIPSKLLRGVLTAIFWFVPPPTHYVLVTSLKEAVCWSISRADASSLTVPDVLRHAGARAFSELS